MSSVNGGGFWKFGGGIDVGGGTFIPGGGTEKSILLKIFWEYLLLSAVKTEIPEGAAGAASVLVWEGSAGPEIIKWNTLIPRN